MQSDQPLKRKTVYLFLFGMIDDDDVESFNRQLKLLLAANVQEVVFNFSSVTGLTGATLNIFAEFYRSLLNKGKAVRIEGVNDYVFERLRSLGLEMPAALPV